MRHDAKTVCMKGFIARHIRRFDPQQIFKRACDVVAFRDLIVADHRRLKPRLGIFGMLGQPHRDIDDIGLPRLHRIKAGTIARDDAAPF